MALGPEVVGKWTDRKEEPRARGASGSLARWTAIVALRLRSLRHDRDQPH